MAKPLNEACYVSVLSFFCMIVFMKLLLGTQHCAQRACAKVCTSLRNYAIVLKNWHRKTAVQFDRLDRPSWLILLLVLGKIISFIFHVNQVRINLTLYFHNFEFTWVVTITVIPRIVSAETILFWSWPYVLWPLVTVHESAETIQGRKLFKGRNYSWKYSR